MIKNTMTAAGLSTALLAGGFAAPAAQAEFSANIGATSNYLWRGVTQTDNGAAIQGGVDYESDIGVYGGLWVSNVGSGDDQGYEADGYVGWGMDFTDDVGLDLGYVHYYYGESDSRFDDFGEIYASVNFWWFEAGLAYTAVDHKSGLDEDTQSFVKGDLYYYVSGSYAVSEDWTLGATVGTYKFDNSDKSVQVSGGFFPVSFQTDEMDYSHWSLDATRGAGDFGDFTFTLARNTNTNQDNDKVRAVVSWVKGF